MTMSTTTKIDSDMERRAPVQGFEAGIPWSMHLRAYDAYKKKYGPQQALIEGWCRGGFGTYELDMFIPGWREELSEITKLQSKLAAKDAEIARLEKLAESYRLSMVRRQDEMQHQADRANRAEVDVAELRDAIWLFMIHPVITGQSAHLRDVSRQCGFIDPYENAKPLLAKHGKEQS